MLQKLKKLLIIVDKYETSWSLICVYIFSYIYIYNFYKKNYEQNVKTLLFGFWFELHWMFLDLDKICFELGHNLTNGIYFLVRAQWWIYWVILTVALKFCNFSYSKLQFNINWPKYIFSLQKTFFVSNFVLL